MSAPSSPVRGSKPSRSRNMTAPNIHFSEPDTPSLSSSPTDVSHLSINKRSSTLMALAGHGPSQRKSYGGVSAGGGGGGGYAPGHGHGNSSVEGLFGKMARVRQTFSENDMRDILDDRELSKSFEGLPLDEKEIKRQPKKLRPYYAYLSTLRDHYTEVDELLRSSLPAQIATSFRPAESALTRFGGKAGGRGGAGKKAGRGRDGRENGDAGSTDGADEELDGGPDQDINGYTLDGPEPHPHLHKTRTSHMEGNELNHPHSGRSGRPGRGKGEGQQVGEVDISSERDVEREGEEEHLLGGAEEREAKREKVAKLALNVNFGINTVLLISKAIAVLSSSSISLVASFVDSALDFLSTLIILGTSIAMGVKSERHAYPVGKRRFEPLGVLIFSVAMIASFAQVFIESFQRAIAKPDEAEVAELSKVGIATMVATVVVKGIVWFWCSKMPSTAVRALAQDAQNDVFFNLMSLAFPSIGSALHWRLLDPIGGMILSLYIIYEWVKTLNENFQKLSGKTASIDEISRVLYLVSRFKPVQEIASIEVYHIGDDLVVEIDVILPETTTLHFAHDLGETIQCVIESLDHVARAYVHTDYSSYNPLSHTTAADRAPNKSGGPSPQSSNSSKGTIRAPPSAEISSQSELQTTASGSIMPKSNDGPKRIPLYISGPKAYCWDAQDVAILRVTHRICGIMAGTLPGVSQQNMFLGLPLVLMPEEVVLLIEDGICELINVPTSKRPPTSLEIAAYTKSRLEDISSQREHAARTARERQAEVEQKLGASDAVLRKREKREKEKKGKKKVEEREGSVDRVEDAIELFGADQAEGVPGQKGKAHVKDSTPYFSTVPATSIPHPWFDPTLLNSTYPDLESAQRARVWTYPTTLLERARCAAFRKLWEEGMFMGQGIRFGGDFVVYPGDPLRYHSHFATTTLPTPSTVIRPLELVAWGRLGTATKKAHLICCYDETERGNEDNRGEGGEDEGMVECYSLEWGNFG